MASTERRRGGFFRELEKHATEVTSPAAKVTCSRLKSIQLAAAAPVIDAYARSCKRLGEAGAGHFVKVVHNGKVVHENVEVTGPTRAATYSDEKPLGPLMLQGDHGPVAYRNIRIQPLGTR